MPNNGDSGHATNIANFQKLINAVVSFGPAYAPSKDAYKVPALQAQYTACAGANSAVKGPLADYNQTTTKRTSDFIALDRLTTRLIAMFRSSDAGQQVKDFAKTRADKIRGFKKKASPAPAPSPENGETPEDKKHSTSQRSYVMRAENFDAFINILKAEPSFAPTEADLQMAQLESLQSSLIVATNTVDLSYKSLKNVRYLRNDALYKAETGMVEVAKAVKDYVKGAFGASSPQYKEISGLRFTRPSNI